MSIPNAAVPDAATQLEIYRRMSLIMQNDEASRKVIRSGRLMMPYYSQRGQEVIMGDQCHIIGLCRTKTDCWLRCDGLTTQLKTTCTQRGLWSQLQHRHRSCRFRRHQ